MNIEEVKEEAKKIIELFTSFCYECDYVDRAKEHALIYCEGVKREYENYTEYNQQNKSRFDFWQQVKEYIKNNY